MLSNTEEATTGYHALKSNQNRNEIADSVELTKQCAAIIDRSPVWEYTST